MPIRFLAKERRNSLQRIIIDKVLKTDYIFFFFGQDLPYHLIKSSRLVDCLLVQISCYVGAYLLIQIIVQMRIWNFISREIRHHRRDVIKRLNHQNVLYGARVDKPLHYFIIFICRYQNIWLLSSGRMKIQYQLRLQ